MEKSDSNTAKGLDSNTRKGTFRCNIQRRLLKKNKKNTMNDAGVNPLLLVSHFSSHISFNSIWHYLCV